ncbi:hypothetical protein F511_35924 [Dorcoceras hygrometricum]|uniref:Dystroglycan-like n=1 Tax=Dorcoceras hygrometricum TaxID=472368 RepID=A0A2Z7A4F8_9LAMI|nr:hypothetical protein F511_35924 [Dorcoceras hygrometricum]
MVAMFEALVASGLNGFLGCFSDIYEAALVEFFQNASVRDGQVISTVQGKLVEISEEVFARTFELPVEGLMDLNEVPKDLVFDARSVFSFNGEQLSTSCKKREMKFEFRLLCDILAKLISIKQVRTQRSLDDLKSELLFKIDNIAKASAEARDQQTQYIQNSIKSVRQEAQTQVDVLSRQWMSSLLLFEVKCYTSVRKHRKIISTFQPNWDSLFIISIGVVMPKRGKVIASVLSLLRMIKADQVGAVVAEVVVVMVAVKEETGVVLRRKYIPAAVEVFITAVEVVDQLDL